MCSCECVFCLCITSCVNCLFVSLLVPHSGQHDMGFVKLQCLASLFLASGFFPRCVCLATDVCLLYPLPNKSIHCCAGKKHPKKKTAGTCIGYFSSGCAQLVEISPFALRRRSFVEEHLRKKKQWGMLSCVLSLPQSSCLFWRLM